MRSGQRKNEDEAEAPEDNTMKYFKLDDVEIKTDVEDMTEEEVLQYLRAAQSRTSGKIVKMTVKAFENNELDVKYECQKIKFERIRRITGYLVGTLDKWNDAKRAEEKQRVKHL
jgi:hypothetical protein